MERTKRNSGQGSVHHVQLHRNHACRRSIACSVSLRRRSVSKRPAATALIPTGHQQPHFPDPRFFHHAGVLRFSHLLKCCRRHTVRFRGAPRSPISRPSLLPVSPVTLAELRTGKTVRTHRPAFSRCTFLPLPTVVPQATAPWPGTAAGTAPSKAPGMKGARKRNAHDAGGNERAGRGKGLVRAFSSCRRGRGGRRCSGPKCSR